MIYSFRGEYAFLSNFYRCRIIYQGRQYKTVEHAYQAAKAIYPADKVLVQQSRTPAEAKRLGRHIALREDWSDIRIVVMIDLIHLKFRDPVLRAKLMATFPDQLQEGNTWGDRFWGTVNGQGQNALGKILMAERAELMR